MRQFRKRMEQDFGTPRSRLQQLKVEQMDRWIRKIGDVIHARSAEEYVKAS